MPELPEVERFRRCLESTSLHQTIDKVEVRDGRILDGIGPRDFEERLAGLQFQSALRHGKRLFLKAGDRVWLTFHMGMTGSLRYLTKDIHDSSGHDRIIICFGQGGRLIFDDPRIFGRAGLTADLESFIEDRGLGPDILDLDWSAFQEILGRKRGRIKSVLLDQSAMAGLGNLYSDEALFQAGICPGARSLDKDHQKRLFQAIQMVMETALSSGSDLPESFLIHSRKRGGRCPLDGSLLMRSKVAGRTTYYCPKHQK